MYKKLRTFCILLLILSVVFACYFNSNNITSWDSTWTIFTAMSMIKQGNVDLDEYRDKIESDDYKVESVNGHIYNYFPIGTALIAAPFVWAIDASLNIGLSKLPQIQASLPFLCSLFSTRFRLALLIISLFVVLASVGIYFIVNSFVSRRDYWFLVFSCTVFIFTVVVSFIWVIDACLNIALAQYMQLPVFPANLPIISPLLEYWPFIELFIASLLMALSAVFIYLIAALFVDRQNSLLITFIFSFCTSIWSTASRALWSHCPSVLMLTITLYLILLAKNKPWIVQFVSLPLAFSYIIRPTNSISVLLITVFIFLQYKKYFLRYLLLGLLVFVPFLSFNYSIYHAFLSHYYLFHRISAAPYFFEALMGNLISPGRGLFIFSPIFLFSLVGFIWKIKNKQGIMLDYFLFAIILLHWVMISCFPIWWAGHSFGPRFFTDLIPFFIYFLIFFVAGLGKEKSSQAGILISVFICAIGFSLFVHLKGASDERAINWNKTPVWVEFDRARIWDWQDLQFLRKI